MRSHFIYILAASALLASAAPAMAQDPREDFKTACVSDYKRFCFGVLPGGGRILACLGGHMSELAPACATAVGMGLQCVDDYKKFCDGASPGNGELKACLEANRANLSSACAETISAAAAPR